MIALCHLMKLLIMLEMVLVRLEEVGMNMTYIALVI